MYKRKTRDAFVVQGNYGPPYGWEDVTAEETRSEARARLREYRENEPQYRHRLIVRRERIDWQAALRGHNEAVAQFGVLPED